jgi:hypothetical protein
VKGARTAEHAQGIKPVEDGVHLAVGATAHLVHSGCSTKEKKEKISRRVDASQSTEEGFEFVPAISERVGVSVHADVTPTATRARSVSHRLLGGDTSVCAVLISAIST